MSACKHSAVSFGTSDMPPPDVGSTIGPISLHNAIEPSYAYYAFHARVFVEDCLERIGEDNPEEEQIFRDLFWEDETQREIVIESLKADCEVRAGRPPGL
jgi:hypothetical protein